ncbi:MAG: PilN domain-containing protein [Phycisphaerae bacterium]
MKTVNFLPDWYRQQQRQGRNVRVHLGVMVLLGAGIAGARMLANEHVHTLEATQAQLAAKVEQVGDPTPELEAKRTELKRLQNIQQAYKELGNTIPMSAVIQQILNDMTMGMALSHVGIDVHTEAIKGSGILGDVQHPPRTRAVAHIAFVGVAPNDVLIAQLVGKISQNPLFSDVSLNYTHTELLADRSIRRFEIQMTMDLDRLAVDDGQGGATPTQQAHSGMTDKGGASHAG